MFEKLKKEIRNPNEDDKENNYIAEAREIEKYFKFDKTKVRAIGSCDNFAAPRCIYSQNQLVIREGQKQLK